MMMTMVRRLLAAWLVVLAAGCTMMQAPGIKNLSVSAVCYEPPVLSWWPVARADGYQLQLSSDPDFNGLVLDERSINGTGFQLPPTFEDDVRYWWRVRATGGILASATWSEVHSFAFGVRTPVPRAPRQTSAFQLDWEPVSGAAIYEVAVATAGRMDSPVVDRTVANPPVIIEEGLARGVDYIWRVRAMRGRLVSDWSEPQPLRVEPEGIGIVAPRAAELRTLRPKLAWQAASGATNVQVQFFASRDGITKGKELISDVADASRGFYQPDFNLEAGGKYLYRVRLIFAGGPGPWSEETPLAIAEAAEDGAVALTDSANRHETEPAISPDGTRLAVIVSRKSAKNLQLDRVKEEAENPSAVVVYASKEKGQNIAEASKLVAVAQYGGSARYSNPRFAPSGDGLYAQKTVKGIVTFVLFSGPEGNETAVDNLPDREPAVSPDGAIRVYSAENNGNLDIFTEEMRTHRTEALTTSLADDVNPIIVAHPDGHAVILQSNRSPGGWGIYKIVVKSPR